MKYKRIIISLILFFLVFVFLGVPFSEWGFDRDDCGVIYNSNFSIWPDFYNFFIRNDLHSMVHASNYAVPPQYFFSVFYRPLTFFWYGLQLPFFGAWPYGYFLVMIFFHALNVVLFFNMIVPFFSLYLWAILCALLFAFHASLWVWMGWIAAQPYTISMFFILLATILFFFWLRFRNVSSFLASLFCFVIALFTFEFVIVYPLFLCFLFEARLLLIERRVIPEISRAQYTFNTLGYWIILICFLGLRMFLFPINLTKDTTAYRLNLYKFLSDMSVRLGDVKTFIVHVLGLDWVSRSIPFIKLFLVGAMLVLILWRLVRVRERKTLIWLGLAGSVFLWPAVLRYFVPRYLYYSLPVFLFIFVFLVYRATNEKKLTQTIAILSITFFILINAIYMISSMYGKIGYLKASNRACELLVRYVYTTDKDICFIGVPRDLFWTGLAQQMWLRGLDSGRAIFYDMSTFSCGVHDGKQRMVITPIKGGYRLASLDPSKLWWISWGGEYTEMGEKQVYASDGDHLYDFDFVFFEKYRERSFFL